jgi:regulator of cell morphogenesis and NO signaling
LTFDKTLFMTSIADQTLAAIVTSYPQTAAILEKYQLDFCCKGKRALAAACAEKGVSLSMLEQELIPAMESKNPRHMPFEAMNGDQLISYILLHHHYYVKQAMPQIAAHLDRVANRHGGEHPYMLLVRRLFAEMQDELTQHLLKEENVLFPLIIKLETGNAANTSGISVEGPIRMMLAEHDHAGAIMQQIRQLTDDYTPPADACTTFRLCLSELKAFEEDLHRHVHLENYLLFPLAEKMVQA